LRRSELKPAATAPAAIEADKKSAGMR
jgi:hypothetical protein